MQSDIWDKYEKGTLTNDECHHSLPPPLTLPVAVSGLEAFTKAARTTMQTDYDCALAYIGSRRAGTSDCSLFQTSPRAHPTGSICGRWPTRTREERAMFDAIFLSASISECTPAIVIY